MKKHFSFFSVVKDIIIYGILIFVLVFFIFVTIIEADFSEYKDLLLTLTGDLVIILLGIIGIFEFCYDNDLRIFVPSSFIYRKEKKQFEQIKAILNEYVEKETVLYKELQMDKTGYIISQLGLSKEEFDRISLNVIEARLKPTPDMDSLSQKMVDLIVHNKAIHDLSKTTSYTTGMKYFINFNNLMHSKGMEAQINNIMSNFIFNCIGNKLPSISSVILPHSSNYLLGIGVSRNLGKKFVKVIPPEKRIADFAWEGNIDTIAAEQHVILVHDILLTSKQITESIDALPDNCIVDGIFCIINRVGYGGKEKLTQLGYAVHSLVDWTDEEITNIIEQ